MLQQQVAQGEACNHIDKEQRVTVQVAQVEACNHIDKEQRVTATSCSGESIQNFLQITYS